MVAAEKGAAAANQWNESNLRCNGNLLRHTGRHWQKWLHATAATTYLATATTILVLAAAAQAAPFSCSIDYWV
jgi:hypothetical protein